MSPLRSIGARLASPGRVIAVIVMLLLAGFAASGLIAVRTLNDRLIERLDRQLVDGARTTRAIIDTLPDESIEPLSAAPRPSFGTVLIVTDANGAVIYAAPAERAGVALSLPSIPTDVNTADHGVPFTTGAVDDDLEYRVVAVPTSAGLVVVVAAPLDDVHTTVDVLRGRLALVGGISFILLAFVTWVVVANANRQMKRLVDAASQIGSGDLSVRVDVHGSGVAGKLGGALNSMTSQLEAAFADREASEDRLRRFAADASHELRTPLTHIRGYAELLRSGVASEPEDQHRAVGRIEAETLRMAGLVDDLLLLARLDQQRLLELLPLDLRVLVADSVADARTADPARTYTLSVPDERVVVAGDANALRQVVSNLLANVRTHTPPGSHASVALTVRVGQAVIRFDDDGPGMNEHAAAHAFDRFYRPEDSRSRSTGGSGLGLAIVQGIVSAHGGAVKLEGALGAGTRITVTLPMGGDLSAGSKVSPR